MVYAAVLPFSRKVYVGQTVEMSGRIYQHWRRYMIQESTEKFYQIKGRFHEYLWTPISCGGRTATDSRVIEGLAISDFKPSENT